MGFNLNEYIDFVHFMNLTFDNTCFKLMKTFGRGSSKVFVDVGANIGTVLFPVSLHNDVIVFEPVHSTFLQLTENRNLNRPENGCCRVHINQALRTRYILFPNGPPGTH